MEVAPPRRPRRPRRPGQRGPASPGRRSSEHPPPTSSTQFGHAIALGRAESRRHRHTQLAASSWTALWRIPRRSDDSERPGLCSMVRASNSSKLSKLAGPLTKLVMARGLLLVHAGSDVHQHQPVHELGRAGAAQREGGHAAQRHPHHAVPRARARRPPPPGRRPFPAIDNEPSAPRRSGHGRGGPRPAAGGPARGPRCPRCGRSARPRAPGRARASCCPTPGWRRAIRARPRRPTCGTAGGPRKGMPYSAVFSWNSPNSS